MSTKAEQQLAQACYFAAHGVGIILEDLKRLSPTHPVLAGELFSKPEEHVHDMLRNLETTKPWLLQSAKLGPQLTKDVALLAAIQRIFFQASTWIPDPTEPQSHAHFRPKQTLAVVQQAVAEALKYRDALAELHDRLAAEYEIQTITIQYRKEDQKSQTTGESEPPAKENLEPKTDQTEKAKAGGGEETDWEATALGILMSHRRELKGFGDLFEFLQQAGYPHARESLYKMEKLKIAAQLAGIYKPRDADSRHNLPRGHKSKSGQIDAYRTQDDSD